MARDEDARRTTARSARAERAQADRVAEAREPVDPDVDLSSPPSAGEITRQWDVLLAIAAGGVLGAEARYGLGTLVRHRADQFPWSTVVINATGCLLIGILMVLAIEVFTPHRLVRPFLGTGILGGYTTFSTFALDAVRLAHVHRVGTAIGYVATTLVVCAAAVWVGAHLTRRTCARALAGRAVGG